MFQCTTKYMSYVYFLSFHLLVDYSLDLTLTLMQRFFKHWPLQLRSGRSNDYIFNCIIFSITHLCRLREYLDRKLSIPNQTLRISENISSLPMPLMFSFNHPSGLEKPATCIVYFFLPCLENYSHKLKASITNNSL